jgi:nucleotide-binding universal stress UspA family protein
MDETESPNINHLKENSSRTSGLTSGLSPYSQKNIFAATEPPVIWAIDAYPDELELHIKSACALQAMFPKSKIFPVYVLSEESFTERGYSSFLKPALKPMATKAIAKLLTQFDKLNLQKPRVLVEVSASRTACARKLLRFAERTGAAQIALGCHARKSLSRFFIGSFSETLVGQSRLPVLVAGPHCTEMNHGPEVIVFPTRFTSENNSAFTDILDLAVRMRSELHLFHKTSFALDSLAQGGVQLMGGGWVTFDPYQNPDQNHQDGFQRQAQSWLNQAASRGIKTRIVSENFREPTSHAIVEYVNHLGDRSALVAMTFLNSRVGTVKGALLGSVTLDVIRASTCPVYLLPRIA